MKPRLAIALSLVAAAACAHHEPVQHSTVSAVGNEDVTGNKSDPDNKKMSYTEVSDADALNRTRANEEYEALHGHLNRSDVPAAALQQPTPSAPAESCGLNVYFETASAELNNRAKQQLDSVAGCLKRTHTEDALVLGSADPRGSEPQNAELGKERARKVAEYLKALGVPQSEIRIRSLGESQASAEPSTWPAERRAQVKVQ